MGDYTPITISASAYNEFDGDIALTYGELPAGVSGAFSVDSFKVGETTLANFVGCRRYCSGQL